MRNDGVAVTKALAIILMVLGHSGCPEGINNFLGIIRMPVFFLMSGYCFKPEYLESGTKYLRKRITGIYVPYVKWGLFFLLMHNLLCYFGLYKVDYAGTHLYTINETVHRAATILLCMSPEEQLIGGFWFLHDLFWGSMLFYSCLKMFKKSYISIPVLLSAAILMSYFNLHLSYILYPRTIMAAVFITFGYVFKCNEYDFEKSWLYIIGVIVILAVISFFWHSNLLELVWSDILPYVILAIMGSLMLFGIGEYLSNVKVHLIRKLLVYIGENTFNVLLWHFLAFKIFSFAIIIIFGLSWESIGDFPTIASYSSKGWFIGYSIIGVAVPICGTYCYDKIRYSINK